MGVNIMKNRIWISGILIIVLAVAIFFIQSSIRKAETSRFEHEIQKINLGATSPELSALIWVADKKGFFRADEMGN
jgi:hypothetical protein